MHKTCSSLDFSELKNAVVRSNCVLHLFFVEKIKLS